MQREEAVQRGGVHGGSAEKPGLDRLADDSGLRVLRLDVSDGDVAAAADTVADWLEATGGLTTAA